MLNSSARGIFTFANKINRQGKTKVYHLKNSTTVQQSCEDPSGGKEQLSVKVRKLEARIQ
jgi:hypothetical protein